MSEWSYLRSSEANPLYEEVTTTLRFFKCKHVLDLGVATVK